MKCAYRIPTSFTHMEPTEYPPRRARHSTKSRSASSSSRASTPVVPTSHGLRPRAAQKRPHRYHPASDPVIGGEVPVPSAGSAPAATGQGRPSGPLPGVRWARLEVPASSRAPGTTAFTSDGCSGSGTPASRPLQTSLQARQRRPPQAPSAVDATSRAGLSGVSAAAPPQARPLSPSPLATGKWSTPPGSPQSSPPTPETPPDPPVSPRLARPGPAGSGLPPGAPPLSPAIGACRSSSPAFPVPPASTGPPLGSSPPDLLSP